MENINFKDITLDEFNEKFKLNATEMMDTEEFIEYVNANGQSNFVVSYSEETLIQNIRNNLDIVEHLLFEYYYLDGMYIVEYWRTWIFLGVKGIIILGDLQ